MLRILVLVVLTSMCHGEEFDMFEFDYCSPIAQCESNIKNPACDCKVKGSREIIQEGVVEFRQKMLDAINERRNFIAGGNEPHEPVHGEASDMMAVNYDLELEYIAMCAAAKFEGDHDKCRKDHLGQNYGQNLAATNIRNIFYNEEAVTSQWYGSEVTLVSKQLMEHFNGGEWGHFTQLVWWSLTSVGCARVWNPDFEPDVWRFAIICNFKCYENKLCNGLGEKVYTFGPKCSACPFGTQCEDPKYPNLCGKANPVPTRILELGSNAETKQIPATLILCLGFVLIQ